MSETLKFKTYCIEAYKYAKGMTGKEVNELFTRYGVLDYINEFFLVLHSTSISYIVDDIEIFIKARRSA